MRGCVWRHLKLSGAFSMNLAALGVRNALALGRRIFNSSPIFEITFL